MHEHFIPDVIAELGVAPDSKEALKIEAICYRFAEKYGTKLEISLGDIINIARKVQFHMSEKKLLGQWDRILPDLLERNKAVYKIFWHDDYLPAIFITETRKQLLHYAVAAGILEPSMLARHSAGAITLEASEDPCSAKPAAKPAVTYYEVPISPPAQTKIYPDPMPVELRVGGIATAMSAPVAHGAGVPPSSSVAPA
jgi:hypothetical protein